MYDNNPIKSLVDCVKNILSEELKSHLNSHQFITVLDEINRNQNYIFLDRDGQPFIQPPTSDDIILKFQLKSPNLLDILVYNLQNHKVAERIEVIDVYSEKIIDRLKSIMSRQHAKYNKFFELLSDLSLGQKEEVKEDDKSDDEKLDEATIESKLIDKIKKLYINNRQAELDFWNEKEEGRSDELLNELSKIVNDLLKARRELVKLVGQDRAQELLNKAHDEVRKLSYFMK